LQCVAVCCSVLQRVAACCSVLQCVAVCCSVLQCVAVCGITRSYVYYDPYICDVTDSFAWLFQIYQFFVMPTFKSK